MNIMQRLLYFTQTITFIAPPPNNGEEIKAKEPRLLAMVVPWGSRETDVPQRRWEDQPEQGELTKKEHTYHLWLCQFSWKAVPWY